MLFAQISELDEPLRSLALLRATVDWAGTPIAAFTTPERAAGAVADDPPPAEPFPLFVFRLEGGGEWSPIAELETTLRRPHVQPLPDGLLVVGTHSLRHRDGTVEPNGIVYDESGDEAARLSLGDGVEDVQVTPAGAVWVSYSDDGTTGDFGRYGWGRLSPVQWVDPIGRAGLVRFDRTGERAYELDAPWVAESAIDCFALNLCGEQAWACYHPRFPLVRVDGAVAEAWETGGVGADALAISGRRVALYVTYGLHRNTCWLGTLGDGSIEREGPVAARLGGHGDTATIRAVIGRGSSLHAVTAEGWYRFDLAPAEADLAG